MKQIILCFSWILLIPLPRNVSAQEANNPLLYSHQAVQFGDQQVSHDPVTLVLPGVAHSSGFSSYLDNPASAALFESGFGSLGLSFRNVHENSSFLGNQQGLNDNQFGISNLGFVYTFPTVRGSLIFGAGYSQHSYYNRALSISGRNTSSTITDAFKIPGSIYEEVAFDTYAIDWADVDETFFDSIFRIGVPPGNYPGITQEAEILERGSGGDYSVFMATEFLENLLVGVSLGIRSGRYNYDRTFLEIDDGGPDGIPDYEGEFIETEEGDTDIDTILLSEEMRSEYLSLAARIGTIYQFSDHVNIGLSYTFPSRLAVEEEFDILISSTFDNGVVFEGEEWTEFSWSVTSPGRLGLGAALVDFGGLTLSAAAEHVNYAATRLSFDTGSFEDERNENRFIEDTYRRVWNLRGGIEYAVSPEFRVRAGYGLKPSRFKHLNVDEHQISGGVSFDFGPDTRLDLGARYAFFDESSVLYDYEDENFVMQSALVDREVQRLQILATVRMRLY